MKYNVRKPNAVKIKMTENNIDNLETCWKKKNRTAFDEKEYGILHLSRNNQL